MSESTYTQERKSLRGHGSDTQNGARDAKEQQMPEVSDVLAGTGTYHVYLEGGSPGIAAFYESA